MRIHLLTVLLFLSATTLNFAQTGVGIGTTRIDSSAVLDIRSNSKGLLIPRLTGAAISQINRPSAGLMVFDAEKQAVTNYTRVVGDTIVSQTSGSERVSFTLGGSVGQSFKVTGDSDLHSIRVALSSSVVNTVFTAKLYDGHGTRGRLIDSASVTRLSSGKKSYVFDFSPSGIRLVAGRSYTFIITNSGSSASYYRSSTNEYPNGSIYIDGTSDKWDLEFAIISQGAGKWQTFPKAGPEAWGVVFSDGFTLGSNSENFSVNNNAAGIYTISFSSTGLKNANIGNLPVNLSLFGGAPGFITYTGANGVLQVNTFGTNGLPQNRGFTFLVYYP